MHAKLLQFCPTLCDPMDCSLPDFSVLGILQARILEWVTVLFSRGSSQPRDLTQISCTAGRFFLSEPPGEQVTLIWSPSYLCASSHPPIPSLRIFLFSSDLHECLLSCSFLTFNLIVCSIQIVRCPGVKDLIWSLLNPIKTTTPGSFFLGASSFLHYLLNIERILASLFFSPFSQAHLISHFCYFSPLC